MTETEIAEFERRSPVKVNFLVEGDVHTETDSQRIALQSVTRAALANVSKHAAADNVAIRLRATARTITRMTTPTTTTMAMTMPR